MGIIHPPILQKQTGRPPQSGLFLHWLYDDLPLKTRRNCLGSSFEREFKQSQSSEAEGFWLLPVWEW